MSNITILRQGIEYDFYSSFDSLAELPSLEFTLKQGPLGRIYLEETEIKKLPEKIYSNDEYFINHVLKSFNSGNSSMGILLTGKKGLGKTFTARVLCSKLNIPVIKITSNFKEVEIFSFLNNIKQPHCILIDEFEKIFPEYTESNEITQLNFLSYLDGSNSSNSKKLFLITSNEPVNKYFLNRPSRIRYVRNYSKIDKNIVLEITDDLLKNNSHREDLLSNLDYDDLNIDTLIKIIEEIIITNQPYSYFRDFFNYSVENNKYTFFLYKKNGSLSKLSEKMITNERFRDMISNPGDIILTNESMGHIYFESVISEDFDECVINCYTYKKGETNEMIKHKIIVKRSNSNIRLLI